MRKDIKYKKFQRLGSNGVKFIKDSHRVKGVRHAVFLCHCGKEFTCNIQHIKTEWIKGCGCSLKTKNGLSKTPLYTVWNNMHRRCKSTQSVQYKDYGGRGIRVCKEWGDFMNFYKWALEHNFKQGLFIDRVDNDKNYSPQNCHFVTRTTNNLNKRSSLIFNGENAVIASKRLGGQKGLVSIRITQYGWTPERAFNTPVKHGKKRK